MSAYHLLRGLSYSRKDLFYEHDAIKTYLDVPYHHNEVVKSLGARFDYSKRRWYCPVSVDLMKFSRWLPEKLREWAVLRRKTSKQANGRKRHSNRTHKRR
jgi:hypothetical protein